MNAQVLTTRTSASSARDVISIPRCKTLPSMISASTRFLAQPRLIMPTFTRCTGRHVACLLCLAEEFAVGTLPLQTSSWRARSVDRHVLIVLLQRLAVLSDRDGFRIEHPNRYVLAAKFNRTVSRGNPSFERGFPIIAYRHPHVRSFERPNGHPILFARFV